MWYLLVANAFGGAADDLVGTWRLDVARSDPTEAVIAALAPPPGGPPGSGPPGGMGGGPPGGMSGGPPGGMSGGPPGGMGGGGMGGGPGDAPEPGAPSGAPDGGMVLVGLLLGGTFGLQLGATDDNVSIAWGPTPSVALVIDGPAVKVPTPAGTLRARARTTSFGVALERKVKGAILTETLFREGDALIVAIEAVTPGREVVFLRRVYRAAPPSPAPSPPPPVLR